MSKITDAMKKYSINTPPKHDPYCYTVGYQHGQAVSNAQNLKLGDLARGAVCNLTENKKESYKEGYANGYDVSKYKSFND